MIKTYLKILLVLLVFAYQAKAQSPDWFRSSTKGNFQSPDFYINKAKAGKLLPTDSIKLQINNQNDVDKIINSGLSNHVFGIEIININRPDLKQIITRLSKLSKVIFLAVKDREVPFWDDKPYQLPAEIRTLHGLIEIEFANTDKIDMDDALKKLLPLKQLWTLSIIGYDKTLTPALIDLKQLSRVKLSTIHIGNSDLSSVNWQEVDINEHYARAINLMTVKPPPPDTCLMRLSRVKSLNKLYLSANLIKNPSVLSNFTQITHLQVGGLGLSSQTAINEIGNLTGLQSLSINIDSKRPLSIKPLQNLTGLTNLSLQGRGVSENEYGVTDLEVIGGFRNLDALNMRSLNIGNLPDIFYDMPKLKKVLLVYNGITEVPLSLFNLPDLRSLDLDMNKLITLPEADHYSCEKLSLLNVAANQLSAIPTAFIKLPNLTDIDFHDNQLTDAGIGWEKLKHLKKVDLSRNKLLTFPDGLQSNINVEEVSVYANSIAGIPDITGTGHRLKSLTLSSNPIKFLPSNIGKYAKLISLDASNTSLASLPESLGQCINLEKLWLSKSIKGETALPPGLKNAHNLQSLYLSGNPMLDSKSIFDVVLSTPRKPLRLFLSGNNITELPPSKQWAAISIRELDLSGNKLRTLPKEFALTKMQPKEIIIPEDRFSMAYELSSRININGNLFKGDNFIYQIDIQTPADLKLAYDEMGANYPDNLIRAPDYAISVSRLTRKYYEKGNWQKVVEYADKAKKIDSAAYVDNARLDEIGISRCFLKDYEGALKDLDEGMKRNYNSWLITEFSDGNVGTYKIKALMALNRKREVAVTLAGFGTLPSLANALKICNEINDTTLYRVSSDSALANYQRLSNGYNTKDYYNAHEMYFAPKGTYPGYFLVSYATLLMMEGKPADALEILSKTERDGSSSYLSIKGLLSTAARYLLQPDKLENLKRELTEIVNKHNKADFSYSLAFEKWISYSNYSQKQQQDLIALQAIAK